MLCVAVTMLYELQRGMGDERQDIGWVAGDALVMVMLLLEVTVAVVVADLGSEPRW